jgi:prepilin-type N-terminal cleavage/methylation domain-containing protein
MQRCFSKSRDSQDGFSILEMLLATVILLVGLVAIAQLVPASILMNYRNRTDSSALVFAQRELDQMLAQPLSQNSFVDILGNTCQLGDPTNPNAAQGPYSSILTLNNQTLINFSSGPTPSAAPTSGYGFTYQDPTDPSGTTYDVRWTVIVTGNGTTASSKRFILGVRQVGGSGYFQPITLDAMVSK